MNSATLVSNSAVLLAGGMSTLPDGNAAAALYWWRFDDPEEPPFCKRAYIHTPKPRRAEIVIPLRTRVGEAVELQRHCGL